MTSQVIQAEWKRFEAAVLPTDAGPGQRRDMQTAFVAGASHMFLTMIEAGALSEDDAQALFQAIDNEITAFGLMRVLEASMLRTFTNDEGGKQS